MQHKSRRFVGPFESVDFGVFVVSFSSRVGIGMGWGEEKINKKSIKKVAMLSKNHDFGEGFQVPEKQKNCQNTEN